MIVKSIFRSKHPDAITTIETTIGAIVVIETDAMAVVTIATAIAVIVDTIGIVTATGVMSVIVTVQIQSKSVQRLIVIAVAFYVVFAINAAWISRTRVNQTSSDSNSNFDKILATSERANEANLPPSLILHADFLAFLSH